MKSTKKTNGYARRSVQALKRRQHPLAPALADSMQEMIELALQVVDQTERRVSTGVLVPAAKKVVSLQATARFSGER